MSDRDKGSNHLPVRQRNKKGSAISETGPALFLLFLVVVFPLIDFMYLGAAFGIGWYLNHIEVRDVALRAPKDKDEALQDVDTEFFKTGISKFTGLTADTVKHSVAQNTGATPPTVTVTTEATVTPLLKIPFPVKVPGLNAPVTFNLSSTRLQEELGDD